MIEIKFKYTNHILANLKRSPQNSQI